MTRYNVVVREGYCLRPFGKFSFLCLLAAQPERKEVELWSVSFVPDLLSGLVWWVVETMDKNLSR